MLGTRKFIVVAGILSALGVTMAPAFALDCQQDVQAFTSRREAQIKGLNAAKSRKGQLDPVAACPRLRNLAAIEGQLVAYMVKNKDWCQIPDTALANVTSSRNSTAALAGKACGLVAQIAKIKRQQAQQQAAGGVPGPGGPPQAPRLPTGPL